MSKELLPGAPRANRQSSRRLIPVSETAAAEELARANEQEIEKLHLLLETAQFLGTEQRLERLMPRIVDRTSQIMRCERSSVFLLDRDKNELYSIVAQGLDAKEIRFSAEKGLAGAAATAGRTLNVPDAYADPRFNPEVDKRTGFKTTSVLAMPLRNRNGEVLGVLQCLNKRAEGGRPTTFNAVDESFLAAIAGLAAVFLENAKLYGELDHLLESVVEAVSQAIDDRDSCTSGHSRRVTLYSLNLARAVHECRTPPFDTMHYTPERLRQLRYAGLLHDVGKIGVREYILCKADKLPENGVNLIRARLELLAERALANTLEQAIKECSDPGPLLAERYAPLKLQIDQALALVEAKNKPGFVKDEELAALADLKARGWLTAKEHELLSVRKGNLTASEWDDMRSHVTKSYQILLRIPWPAALGETPEVAYTHHEKRDGSGYPRKLLGDEIHFDGQVMCVADIYDALTATDRPYKKALPHEVAKKILMEEEAGTEKLLPALVKLFFEAECYKLPEGTRALRKSDP